MILGHIRIIMCCHILPVYWSVLFKVHLSGVFVYILYTLVENEHWSADKMFG